MARLTALPSLDVIRGYKGVLDFYLWKGLPCVRRWPRRPTGPGTEAQIAARTLFGDISAAYSLLAPLELAALQEQAKDQPRTARDLYISAAYGHLHQETAPPTPPPEEQMYDAYVSLRDKKPQATAGGTFTEGDWRTRDLNEETADPEEICTLAANQFVLAAGTYRCLISCPAYEVNRHQARLYNVTAAAVLLLGTNEHVITAGGVTSRSFVVGRFTVAAAQTLEVQHRCRSTRATYGFGYFCNWTDEIYTVVELWREAA